MQTVFFEVQEWEREELGSTFPGAQLVEEKLTSENAVKYRDAAILSTFIYSLVSENVLSQFPNLKLVATRSTGFDHIDVAYCKRKGIVVANVPEYGSNTVAEHTFALILSLTRRIPESISQMKQVNFNHKDIRGMDLYGKTIGIIGLGKIGRQVARIAQGFGMNVVAFTRKRLEDRPETDTFHYVPLDELLRTADIITLHLPLTAETRHLINKKNVSLCKRGSYLINTARGGLVEAEAILFGLTEQIFAGVGMDVFEGEKDLGEEAEILIRNSPYTTSFKTLLLNHVLLNHPKVIITPHNAFNSREALSRITTTTIHTIKEFEVGKLVNTV